MNRNIASALFAIAATVAGQAYAAPDSYEPTVAIAGSSRVRAEVAVEAVQAAKVNGSIVGADTLVKTSDAGTAARSRVDVQTEARQVAHNTAGFLLSPQ